MLIGPHFECLFGSLEHLRVTFPLKLVQGKVAIESPSVTGQEYVELEDGTKVASDGHMAVRIERNQT